MQVYGFGSTPAGEAKADAGQSAQAKDGAGGWVSAAKDATPDLADPGPDRS